MAQRPRGKSGKRAAKSKIAKPEVPPRTAHPPARTLASSSRPTTTAGMATVWDQGVWDQGAYGAGAYGGKPEAVLGGAGGHVANATVIPAGVGVGTGSALSERPVEIRDAARALSREFTAQVEELKALRTNEPDRLDQRDVLLAFFEKMAAGLNNLADALDRAVNAAVDGKPEPALLGKAAEVVQHLQQGVMEWLEENRTTLIEVPVRIGVFGLGLAFVHALGVDGHLVTTLIAGLALKQAPRRRR
jgi:hypothetical protein